MDAWRADSVPLESHAHADDEHAEPGQTDDQSHRKHDHGHAETQTQDYQDDPDDDRQDVLDDSENPPPRDDVGHADSMRKAGATGNDPPGARLPPLGRS